MTLVRGLREARARYARLDLGAAIVDALTVAGSELQSKVTDVLSQPPGPDHSVPWLRTGALRDSIGHDVDGATAIVGSSSDVAVDQELGTRTDPPRPFLASTATDAADELAATIAASLAHYLADR